MIEKKIPISLLSEAIERHYKMLVKEKDVWIGYVILKVNINSEHSFSRYVATGLFNYILNK